MKHVRPTTVVHATLKCEGGSKGVVVRLPAEFVGRLVVNTYLPGSAHIRLSNSLQRRARVLELASLGRDERRMHLPERYACTMFVGDGYGQPRAAAGQPFAHKTFRRRYAVGGHLDRSCWMQPPQVQFLCM